MAWLRSECLLDPEATLSHDYLGCPEIVQDTAGCYASTFTVDLERYFCDATVACIVRVRARKVKRLAERRYGLRPRLTTTFTAVWAGRRVPGTAVVRSGALS
jgi:hypothetical protein